MKCLVLPAVIVVLLFVSAVDAAFVQTNPTPPTASAKPVYPLSLRLRQLDASLYNPLETQQVTNAAYKKILYQQQVKLSGMAVQHGKTTVFNVGLG